jgi:hypothetical protein
LIDACLPHVGVEGMAQIMKPEVNYSCLPASTCKGLLDLLEGASPLRENPVMIQRSDLANCFHYIIRLIAKEDKAVAYRFWYPPPRALQVSGADQPYPG